MLFQVSSALQLINLELAKHGLVLADLLDLRLQPLDQIASADTPVDDGLQKLLDLPDGLCLLFYYFGVEA